jgi:hypothetical protein
MLIGGISALMLQALHPLALAGVWDHSNFRQDMLGRLRRTSQFISGTTFGSRKDAEWLIEKVRTIHLQVVGHAPDGRPYAASDPDLLTWVHVAEVSNFLAAHLRYRNPHLSGRIRIATTQKSPWSPSAGRATCSAFGRKYPITCTHASATTVRRAQPRVLRLLLDAPPQPHGQPFGALMMQAASTCCRRPAPCSATPEPAATPDHPRQGQAQCTDAALGHAQWLGATCPSADGAM